jgi:hypothetical protein
MNCSKTLTGQSDLKYSQREEINGDEGLAVVCTMTLDSKKTSITRTCYGLLDARQNPPEKEPPWQDSNLQSPDPKTESK